MRRRRRDDREQEQPRPGADPENARPEQEITITLDPLTSALFQMRAAIQRHGDEHPAAVKAIQQAAYHLSRDPRREREAAGLLLHVARLTYLRLGPDHPDTHTAVWQAGDMQYAAGNLELAESMFRDALAGRERLLGRDHPDTLAAAQALGVVLTQLGRPAEALALHQDVTERRTRTLGAGHPDTRVSRSMTADALQSAGRIEEAVALFRELVHDTDREFGAASKEAAGSRNNLASAQFLLGNVEEAVELFRAVLASVADKPDQESFAAGVRSNLASALFGLQRYDEAGELLTASVMEQERTLGPDHPDTIRAIANLARVLAVQGDRGEAARLTRRCVSHYEDRLPASHPRLAELRGFLDELS